jgi:hypothetical protein
MAMIKACDGCGKTEREVPVTREYYQTGTVSDGNGGRDDDGHHIDHCHECRAKAAMLAMVEKFGEPHRWSANQAFLNAFAKISGKG